MYVSFPWYDFEEYRTHNDELWARLRARLRDQGIAALPIELERVRPYEEQWCSGRLLLGQACGFDLMSEVGARLRPLLRPVFELDGVAPGGYQSVLLARPGADAEDLESFRGARAAINMPSSHSGCQLLRAMVAPLARDRRFFASVWQSNSHEASLERLAEGAVDVACIDRVSLQLLARCRPSLVSELRPIALSPCFPSPPFVMSASLPEPVAQLVATELGQLLDEGAGTALGIVGAMPATRGDYEAMRTLAREADGSRLRAWPTGS